MEYITDIVFKVVETKGYIPKQVFNCEETGLFWKKSRTYIMAKEKMMPGHKPMTDRLTFAVCTNVTARLNHCSYTIQRTEEPLNHTRF